MLALKEEYTARPAKEETINDPTNPKHYWRYRKYYHKRKCSEGFQLLTLLRCQLFFLIVNTGVHVTLDSLMKDVDLKSTIKNLVSSSGRSVPASGEDVNNKK